MGYTDAAASDGHYRRAEKSVKGKPRNLEEQAISLVGTDIYEKLIKGYTEKQLGRPCDKLPAFIIRRLPVRFTYDNNYFYDRFRGIPENGYNEIIDKMLEGCEIFLNTDYHSNKAEYGKMANKVVYSGTIDSYFDCCLGCLEYRSLRFETERLETANYQGNAVVNYTDIEPPYTRVIEHKHFTFEKGPVTYITKEYPMEWEA